MKRIFAGVLAVCLLSGCTAREQDQELLEQSLNTPFETTAHLQYQGVDARMTIQGDGAARSYTLSFTEPASLADVAMVFTEDKVTVQYQDLSVSVKPETLTDGMAGDILMDTLQTALGSEKVELSRQDGALTAAAILSCGWTARPGIFSPLPCPRVTSIWSSRGLSSTAEPGENHIAEQKPSGDSRRLFCMKKRPAPFRGQTSLCLIGNGISDGIPSSSWRTCLHRRSRE